MSESFSVGDRVEVVIGQDPNSYLTRPISIGQRGTVNEAQGPDGMVGVLYDNGHDCYSLYFSIRKLPPPPREAVSTWDDVIVWKPREVEHV